MRIDMHLVMGFSVLIDWDTAIHRMNKRMVYIVAYCCSNCSTLVCARMCLRSGGGGCQG